MSLDPGSGATARAGPGSGAAAGRSERERSPRGSYLLPTYGPVELGLALTAVFLDLDLNVFLPAPCTALSPPPPCEYSGMR